MLKNLFTSRLERSNYMQTSEGWDKVEQRKCRWFKLQNGGRRSGTWHRQAAKHIDRLSRTIMAGLMKVKSLGKNVKAHKVENKTMRGDDLLIFSGIAKHLQRK
jgi:hypothetical protein